jgi:acetolactate synthase-1/2/3 large subunit
MGVWTSSWGEALRLGVLRFMDRRTAGQAVVDALLAEKVEMVFGLAGSHILSICDSLLDAKSVRFVTVKHENNAASMADVYGRLTHRPGVCLVTAGPGATNSITGVAQAYSAASPMVHISGTVQRQAKTGIFHGLDQPDFVHRIFRDVTKWSVRIDEVEDIPRILAQAFSIANDGRPGPVHVDLPVDLLEEAPTEVWSYESEPSTSTPPDARLVDEVAEMLLAARAPVICAGEGIRASAATVELATLAELLAAPVVFPRDAIDALPAHHPLCAGAFNAFLPNPLPLQLVKESDVLLVIGMRPGTVGAEILDTHAPKNYVFLSPDEESHYAARASVSGAVDSRAMLKELIARLGAVEKVPDREIEKRIAAVKDTLRKGLNEEVESYRGHKPIHFGLALKELVPLLERDALIISDIGTHGAWTSKWLEVHGTQTLVEPGSWGAMGFALPGAIAAKLVHPEKQVIGVTGDGAFLMSYSDFGTALEVGANVIIVVLNDSRYGMIHKLQMEDFGRTYQTKLRSPDLAKFAESFGAVGIRVEDDSELKDAFNKALAANSPVIVDVVSGYDFPFPSPERFL